MAEFTNFFGVRDDWPDLLRCALECGLRFYVDDWYAESAAPCYEEVTDAVMAHIMSAKPRVFLAGSFTTILPLFYKQASGPRRGQYFIDSSRAGGIIPFTLPGGMESKGRVWMQSGSLQIRSEYWNADNTECYPTPTSAKAAYAKVVANLKRACIRLRLSRSVWVAPVGYRKLMQNEAVLRVNGVWLTKRECSPQ